MVYDRNNQDLEKMNVIKEMMIHAWKGYEEHAWGSDELKPLSLSSHNWYRGHSMLSTPVDALDTLYIMNLTTEYAASKKLILATLNVDKINDYISVFETTIRILGGLLSAYDLEGDKNLLNKAVEVAEKLLLAFDTETGIPVNHVNPATGRFRPQDMEVDSTTSLACAGSIQLEFQYLSDVTGNPKYAEKALFALEQIFSIEKPVAGMYPKIILNRQLKFSTNEYSIGASGDSFYEYLLKLWLSTGENRYWKIYLEAAEAVQSYMTRKSRDGKHTFLATTHLRLENFTTSVGHHHLTCFTGGMFATGALAKREGNWAELLALGKQITESCFDLYNTTKTGFSAETVNGDLRTIWQPAYYLRPETAESIFYMWRYTHDPKYREMGWQIVQNLNKWCKLPAGFSGLQHVDKFNYGFDLETGEPIWTEDMSNWSDFHAHNSHLHEHSVPSAIHESTPASKIRIISDDNFPYVDAVSRIDLQNSFFLAETLKYLYLLFSSDDDIPLEKYVFNTEAHILSMRGHGRRADPRKWVPIDINEKSKHYLFKNLPFGVGQQKMSEENVVM
ncbi:Mannosyl-oligosaccharide 1,2-alpha-mannosidase IB [Nowakowskiella sp. JEL0407]|nr:Mannosyl-oligosaccharide 1,2-alpha-mannosidase IB [Nowakowskiella sp. JEL0407]